jgi:hypothetical protein
MAGIQKALGPGGLPDLDHILDKNGGFHIGGGNRGAAVFLGQGSDPLRRKIEIEGLLRRGLGDLPVLAELAMEVAAGSSDGEGTAGRQDMKKGLLLNRIQMDGTGVAIDQAVINPLAVFPNPALAPVSRGDPAESGTEGALNPALAQRKIIGRGNGPDKPLVQILGRSFFPGRKKGQAPSGSRQEADPTAGA